MFSFASRCTCDLLENVVDCLTGCGASSPRSPQAFGSSEIYRPVPQVNDSLYLFHKPEGTPNVQILFFHGLQFGQDYSNAHVSTWENHDCSGVWPQTWLVEDFPKAHVLSVCYTEGLKKGSNGTVDMHIIAENLVSDLLQANIGSSCPVVLVGHSIGGLVIKELCKHAHEMLDGSSEPKMTQLKAFLNNIKGIFYYATPHHGIPIAKRLKDHFGGSLLEYFELLSTPGARLNSRFEDISKVYKWLFAGLGETLPTNLGPFLGVVVPEASARIAGNFNLVEGEDHFSICRPRSNILRNFSKLQEFIQQIFNELEENHENATISKVPRVLLPFLRDPKYVVFKTTMIKVQEALESKMTGPVVTLFGGPGQGKTSMAKYLALCYQNASTLTESSKLVQNEGLSTVDFDFSRFTDGVVFLPCGPNMASKDLLLQLWQILGYHLLPSTEKMHSHASFNTVMQQAFTIESFISNELTRRLSTQKVLIILDDVCDHVLVEGLLFPGEGLKYLVTTQIPQLWSDARCVQIPLDRPTSKEAYQILTNHAYGRPIDITPPLQDSAHAIVEKADHLPLVLANVGAIIRGSVQGEDVDELEEWKHTNKYFEDLIQEMDCSVVLFNHTYPKTMVTCMKKALDSLKGPARTLLLVASIFDSQPVPVPEVLIKLFFKSKHGNLAMFPWSSKELQNRNFIQIDCNDAPSRTVPANKTWSLHAMRQTFIGIIQGREVKSMGDKFLECKTKEDILIELLLLYGQDQWRDQAAKTLGVAMCELPNDSSNERSLQLAPIKSFVHLLYADTRKEPWEDKSHQLAKEILRKYIHHHELDDNSLFKLLSMNETVLQTLEALEQFLTRNPSPFVIPQTLHALASHLEPRRNNLPHILPRVTLFLSFLFSLHPHLRLAFISIPDALDKLVKLLAEDVLEDSQCYAVYALGNLALDVENRMKIVQFPNVIGRLVTLLAEGVGEKTQVYAAFALRNLALDVENRMMIVQFPNAIERLMALVAEGVGGDAQLNAVAALVNLALDVENRMKIVQFPNVIGRLVALLAEGVGEKAQGCAALALGNLAWDIENRMKIVQFPNVIGRLVALLAEGVGEKEQSYAALALGNLALDVENRIMIVQFPNVIVRLMTLLVEGVDEKAQGYAAFTLGNLALDVQNRMKIVQFPHVIGRLVALLVEGVGEDSQGCAALALGHLAGDIENRMKIVEFPNVIGRLMILLAEGVGEKTQGCAALVLGNLALDVENRMKIGQFPNVIERLVALLAEGVGEKAQGCAALALGNLAQYIENRMKIVQFPNVIGRLVALLAESVGEVSRCYAAFTLGNLALDVQNRMKIIQFPHIIGRLVALLAEGVDEDSQGCAALALGNLAGDIENRMKIIEFSNVIERLMVLLAEGVGEKAQGYAALALGNLALDVENRMKIVQFPNVIERLVALLAEGVGEDSQGCAALALGNLVGYIENRMKIVQFPNVIGRLVTLLVEGVGEKAQGYAAFALGNLALDVQNRMKIDQFPHVIGRLVALLAEGVGEDSQGYAALALGNLALDVENRMKIVQFPNVIERLVALLAEGVGENAQLYATFTLGNLAENIENRMKIVQFPNVIGKLVALLAEGMREDSQGLAALALGNLARDIGNRMKIVQFPNVIGRLVALLAEGVGEKAKRYATFALGNLALDIHNRMKIGQFPNVIGRLVALLAEGVGEVSRCYAAITLGNLALDAENRSRIIMKFPNVIERLSAFLVEDFGQWTRWSAAKALRLLTLEVDCGDCEGVLEAYEDGLVAIDPKNHFLLSDRCFVKAKRGDFDGALKDINKFIELGGGKGFGLAERGIVKRMKGDLHGALADLNEWLSAQPDDYECLKHRGLVRFLLSDENGARADAEHAVRVKPGRVDTYGYGSCLFLGTMPVKFLDYDLK